MQFFLMVFSLLLWQEPVWLNDIAEAKKQATEKQRLILLNFSGSDWCIPCIRMKKEYFQSDEFRQYAAENLVLLNADFPRQSKNKLSREVEKRNEALADAYNPKGYFPYSLLLDMNGKVLKTWDGCPEGKPSAFTDEIRGASSKFSHGN